MKEETKKRRQTPQIRKRRYTALVNGEEIIKEKVQETSQERAEALEIVREMANAYIGTIEYYKAAHGGDYPHEEAVKQTLSMNEWRRENVKKIAPEKVSWADLAAVAEGNADAGFALWINLSEAAHNELESGRRAGQVTGNSVSPYALAQFYTIRDSFRDQWQPQGGIELAMIDMLVIAFSLQMHWTTIAYQRATEWHDKQAKEIKRFESAGWKSPYQSEADAVEQAHRLADGYNRQFLRVLRQLRDLRRYTVVIQNNGGQVNVGSQQVNVQEKP